MRTVLPGRRCAVVLAALALGPAVSSTADEPVPAHEPPIETRLIDVGDFARGGLSFKGEPFVPLAPDPASGADEVWFRDVEERARPFGDALDLAAHLRGRFPEAFAREGTSFESVGSRWLLAQQTAAVLDECEDVLDQLRSVALASLVVDVAVVPGDVGTRQQAEIDRACAAPLASARAWGLRDQVVTATTGRELSLAAGRADDVASVTGVDPPVTVRGVGLSFRARLVSHDASGLVVRVEPWWVGMDVGSSGRSPWELASLRAAQAGATLASKPGVWTPLPAKTGAADVTFLVRARLLPWPASRRDGREPAVRPDAAAAGTLSGHRHDVADLTCAVTERSGREIRLVPPDTSLPMEPTPDPPPAIDPKVLVAWAGRRGAIEPSVRSHRLAYRASPARAADLRERLEWLRRHAARITRVEAVLVRMPLASVPEHLSGGAIDASTAAALAARDGARVVDRVSLSMSTSARAAAITGRERPYVAGYWSTVADGAVQGTPIVSSALDGTSLDVAAVPSGVDAVLLEVRWDRSDAFEVHRLPTRWGDLELPRIAVARMRGSFVMPYGTSRIAAATVEGGEVGLLVVSASRP
jgi:hypothetical protein